MLIYECSPSGPFWSFAPSYSTIVEVKTETWISLLVNGCEDPKAVLESVRNVLMGILASLKAQYVDTRAVYESPEVRTYWCFT